MGLVARPNPQLPVQHISYNQRDGLVWFLELETQDGREFLPGMLYS